MGFLARLFGRGGDEPPGWASFFPSGAVYQRFCQAVMDGLARRGLEGAIHDANVQVIKDGRPQSYGLQNLAQLCNRLEPDNWPAAIDNHFDNMFRSQQQAADLDQRAANFEEVRPLIKVRIHPAGHPGVASGQCIHRSLADDLVEILTYDLPTSVVSVPSAHAAGWGRGHDELFELGRQNVRAEGRLSPEPLPAGDGATLFALTADSFFVSSHALLLADYLDPVTRWGALVAVPTRQVVLFHSIEDLRVVKVINTMIHVARQACAQGPGSITDSLYWWRDGRLQRLPVFMNKEQIHFAPPDEFVAVLNSLS